MQLLVLNQNFSVIEVLDVYESLIWTDRYYAYGDFELYTLANVHILETLMIDYYIWSDQSEHVMIIEDREIETDHENGTHLKVTGRSLESILERRIVWKQTVLNGDIQGQIKRLLNNAIINPEDSQRQIPNFIFKESTDPAFNDINVYNQFTGDNLYDVISGICATYGFGYKITLNSSNQFVFELYSGTDRSYSQEKNPFIVFSPNFENILNSNYIQSKSVWKNVALVAGEGEGIYRKHVTVGNVLFNQGLKRRELFVDARDLQSTYSYTDEQGELVEEEIPYSEYVSQLKERGEKYLSENKEIETFDATVDPNAMYKYGEDYFIGDVCQVENEYDMRARVRVTEFIYSESTSGIEMYPTFEAIEEEG